MRTVTVQKLTLGEGRPKVCVPLMGNNRDRLKERMKELAEQPYVELIELRVDVWPELLGKDGSVNRSFLLPFLRELRAMTEKPLLFTFRTAAEGGRPISKEAYRELYEMVLAEKLCDLCDLELAFILGDGQTQKLVEKAHENGVFVVMSYHNFQTTPGTEELFSRLEAMAEEGADIEKIAVMPERREDVLALMSLGLKAGKQKKHPLVLIAMGPLGGLSRIGGEYFGSDMTFGFVGEGSAPGQFPADALLSVLEEIHQSMP